jgi:HAD superfamily hydrolase (TIGR01490 family)
MENNKRGVVFLDLDHTLIYGHSQKLFMLYLLNKGLLNKYLCTKIAALYFMYKLELITDFIHIRKEAFSMLKGISVSKMNRLYDDFFKKVLSPKIKPSMINIINLHKQRKDILVLITATMSEVAQRMTSCLGLDYTIATMLEIKNELYTGNILAGPVYADKKAHIAKKFIESNGFSLTGSYAYTDHISDLPLLLLVDNPVCVSPDKTLRRISKEMGWLVID